MRVKLLEDDERFKLKAGDTFKAERYKYDPREKVTLLSRESDGFIPECNQYIHSVAFWMQGQWMAVRDNVYVPVE